MDDEALMKTLRAAVNRRWWKLEWAKAGPDEWWPAWCLLVVACAVGAGWVIVSAVRLAWLNPLF